MGKYLRRPLIFILCVVIATVLASIASTQFVLADLATAGAPVDLGTRLSMTVYDVINLGPSYGIFIAIALLLAFLASGWASKKTGMSRSLIYCVAGGVSFIVMFFCMKAAFFGIDLIAGSRSGLGKGAQALAGVIAGFIFAKLTPPKHTSDVKSLSA